MAKCKRKLAPAEKGEKERRRSGYMTIFINGRQKRVKREPTVHGIPVEEFIRINADLIWLLKNGMYEELHEWEQQQQQQEKQEASEPEAARDSKKTGCLDDDDLPF